MRSCKNPLKLEHATRKESPISWVLQDTKTPLKSHFGQGFREERQYFMVKTLEFMTSNHTYTGILSKETYFLSLNKQTLQ